MLVEKSIQIIGSKKLNGTIEVSGAKNAVLKQMILPILSEGKYKIENVPDIADVYYMQEVLNVLGITSELTNKSLVIDSPSNISVEAPYEVVQKMRASIIVLGPLLARKGEAKIAFPGGDQLGPRPVKMHIEALEKMGANFELDHGVLVGQTDGLKGVEINLPYASVGATENTLLAAVLADGTTTIEKSELLAALLSEYKIPYRLLNARPENVESESEIVAQAGCKKAITIATNMAGRGTDILLGGNPNFLTTNVIREIFEDENKFESNEFIKNLNLEDPTLIENLKSDYKFGFIIFLQ